MRFRLSLICLNKKVSSTESHQLQKVLQFNCKHTPCLPSEMINSAVPLLRWVLRGVSDPPKEHPHGAAHSHTDVSLYIPVATGLTELSFVKSSKYACTCTYSYKTH